MAKIKSGDLVQVISGADKGKQGKVLKVLPKENRVIVEGVKVVTKHTKANPLTGPAQQAAFRRLRHRSTFLTLRLLTPRPRSRPVLVSASRL